MVTANILESDMDVHQQSKSFKGAQLGWKNYEKVTRTNLESKQERTKICNIPLWVTAMGTQKPNS